MKLIEEYFNEIGVPGTNMKTDEAKVISDQVVGTSVISQFQNVDMELLLNIK